MPSARMEAATLRPTSPNPRMRQVFPAKSNMGIGCGRCPGGAGMPRGVQSWHLRVCACLRRCVHIPAPRYVCLCVRACSSLSLPPSFFPRLPVFLLVECRVCVVCGVLVHAYVRVFWRVHVPESCVSGDDTLRGSECQRHGHFSCVGRIVVHRIHSNLCVFVLMSVIECMIVRVSV